MSVYIVGVDVLDRRTLDSVCVLARLVRRSHVVKDRDGLLYSTGIGINLNGVDKVLRRHGISPVIS